MTVLRDGFMMKRVSLTSQNSSVQDGDCRSVAVGSSGHDTSKNAVNTHDLLSCKLTGAAGLFVFDRLKPIPQTEGVTP